MTANLKRHSLMGIEEPEERGYKLAGMQYVRKNISGIERGGLREVLQLEAIHTWGF
jgi:hypothetical protein